MSARPTTNLLADRTPLSTDAWIRNCRRIGPLRGAAMVKRRVIINLCVDSDNGKAVVRCQRQRAIYTGYCSFGPCCTTCLQLGNRFSLALIPSALPREWVDYLRSQCDWGGCHVAGLKGSQEPAHLWLPPPSIQDDIAGRESHGYEDDSHRQLEVRSTCMPCITALWPMMARSHNLHGGTYPNLLEM